ncbi:hypothetical protein LINPERHAP2_LOCUS33556 [Linum perenne]
MATPPSREPSGDPAYSLSTTARGRSSPTSVRDLISGHLKWTVGVSSEGSDWGRPVDLVG